MKTWKRLGWNDEKQGFIEARGQSFDALTFTQVLDYMSEVKRWFPGYDDYRVDRVEMNDWGGEYVNYYLEGCTKTDETPF